MVLEAKTLGTLQKLGLSAYEAKAYTALVALGPTTATVLSTEAAIPRTKIYEALRRLEDKKWITVSKGRPSTYIPRYPREAVEQRRALFCSEVDELSDTLTLLYDRQIEHEALDALLIRGIDSISAKMMEMVERARRSILIMGSFKSPDEIDKLAKKIRNAKRKDVTVRVIVAFFHDWTLSKKELINIEEAFRIVKNDVRIFIPQHDHEIRENDGRFGGRFDTHGGLPARWVGIDRREIMLAVAKAAEDVDSESTIAIWISNAAITQYLMSPAMFDWLWEISEPIT